MNKKIILSLFLLSTAIPISTMERAKKETINPHVLIEIADRARIENDSTKAIKYYQYVINHPKHTPLKYKAYLWLAVLSRRNNSLPQDTILNYLETACFQQEDMQTKYRSYLYLASAYFENLELDKAKEYYLKAIPFTPDPKKHAFISTQLTLIFMQKEDLPNAQDQVRYAANQNIDLNARKFARGLKRVLERKETLANYSKQKYQQEKQRRLGN